MKRRVISFIFTQLVVVYLLCGCGKNTELEDYKQNMEGFFAEISLFDEKINGIDPNAENAPEQLLTQLDELTDCVQEMADFVVPEQFSPIESLADEAYTNLSQATELFHQVYEENALDSGIEDAAKEYYERANTRFQYILTILQGEVPDESDFVSFTEETEYTEETQTAE